MPKISIIIPVYKVEDYIERCISSVLKQTIKGFEVIVVDDCSPDMSIEIAKSITDAYTGIDIDFVYCRHEVNKGLSASRNTGMGISRGDYLFFLDSDDYLFEDCIEQFVNCLKVHPDVDVIQGNTDSNSPILKKGVSLNARNLPNYTSNRNWIGRALLNSKIIPVTAWNKLVKRSLIINHNLLFEEGIIHEDVLWSFFLAKYVKKMAVIDAYTYMYWQRDNSIMTNTNKSQDLNSFMIIINVMLRNITSDCSKSQKQRLLKLFLYRVVKDFNGYYREIQDKIYQDIYNNSTMMGGFLLKMWMKTPNRIRCNRIFVAPFAYIYSAI